MSRTMAVAVAVIGAAFVEALSLMGLLFDLNLNAGLDALKYNFECLRPSINAFKLLTNALSRTALFGKFLN